MFRRSADIYQIHFFFTFSDFFRNIIKAAINLDSYRQEVL